MDRAPDVAIPDLSVAVVGAAYPNKDGGNRRTEIAFCDSGEPVSLVREPKNKHDEHAIAVFSARRFQIGYVASVRAVYLGGLICAGHELHAVFQDVAPWGAIIRVGVDRAPVNIPPPRDRDDDPPDELDQRPPDEIWPDETFADD